jgi:hypothetical protein
MSAGWEREDIDAFEALDELYGERADLERLLPAGVRPQDPFIRQSGWTRASYEEILAERGIDHERNLNTAARVGTPRSL